MRVQSFSMKDVATWWQRGNQQLFLGDVLDHTSDAVMGVGFARYRKGEANPWTVSYSEVLIVTKGVFTVLTPEGLSASASVGEVIYLPAGAEVIYQADEDTELVYVAHPHWFEATENSPFADKLQEFRPASS